MRDSRDLRGFNYHCRIHRCSCNGGDLAIYAGPDSVVCSQKDVRSWCINCGQPLNWVNAKVPFLCSLCQKREAEGLVILATRPGINIVGIPADAFNEPGLGVVVKFFRNGDLKIKSLK